MGLRQFVFDNSVITFKDNDGNRLRRVQNPKGILWERHDAEGEDWQLVDSNRYEEDFDQIRTNLFTMVATQKSMVSSAIYNYIVQQSEAGHAMSQKAVMDVFGNYLIEEDVKHAMVELVNDGKLRMEKGIFLPTVEA